MASATQRQHACKIAEGGVGPVLVQGLMAEQDFLFTTRRLLTLRSTPQQIEHVTRTTEAFGHFQRRLSDVISNTRINATLQKSFHQGYTVDENCLVQSCLPGRFAAVW